MRLPKTSRKHPGVIRGVRPGRGDFIAGGVSWPPFLRLDGARPYRPLVFGEVFEDLEGYPAEAAEMFSGRQSDPCEWAVMWKEVLADGVCIRLSPGSRDPSGLVQRITDRTGLPAAVHGDRTALLKIASEVTSTRLILISSDGWDGVEDELKEVAKLHIPAVPPDFRTELENAVAMPLGFDAMKKYRTDGLDGDPGCALPILADATGAWKDVPGIRTARRMSMMEAMDGLCAMMAGADIVIVKGPGAADMVRVYAEELADL